MNFNPNMMTMSDLMQVSPMMNQAGSMYGSALPAGMKDGMMSQMGHQMMNQPGGQPVAQPQGMGQMDMYRMAAGALQGMGKAQQPTQMPQLPIMRDSNQFRFAGMQQNPQMLAQALRNRG
jgi:hypothetical protein